MPRHCPPGNGHGQKHESGIPVRPGCPAGDIQLILPAGPGKRRNGPGPVSSFQPPPGREPVKPVSSMRKFRRFPSRSVLFFLSSFLYTPNRRHAAPAPNPVFTEPADHNHTAETSCRYRLSDGQSSIFLHPAPPKPPKRPVPSYPPATVRRTHRLLSPTPLSPHQATLSFRYTERIS